MADSQLALYYFDGKGRAETARLILVAADKKYKDIRFNYAEWPQYKHLAPFGQCPILEIDGEIYSQSLAIKRYLAKEFGFYGRTHLECLKIDQLTHLVEDFAEICGRAMFTGTEEEIKKAIEKTKEEVSPKYLGYFEKLLQENNTGYFCADRLTLADITVFDVVTGFMEKCVHVDSSYPLLQKNLETTRSHSKIGPYIASRPITPF